MEIVPPPPRPPPEVAAIETGWPRWTASALAGAPAAENLPNAPMLAAVSPLPEPPVMSEVAALVLAPAPLLASAEGEVVPQADLAVPVALTGLMPAPEDAVIAPPPSPTAPGALAGQDTPAQAPLPEPLAAAFWPVPTTAQVVPGEAEAQAPQVMEAPMQVAAEFAPLAPVQAATDGPAAQAMEAASRPASAEPAPQVAAEPAPPTPAQATASSAEQAMEAAAGPAPAEPAPQVPAEPVPPTLAQAATDSPAAQAMEAAARHVPAESAPPAPAQAATDSPAAQAMEAAARHVPAEPAPPAPAQAVMESAVAQAMEKPAPRAAEQAAPPATDRPAPPVAGGTMPQAVEAATPAARAAAAPPERSATRPDPPAAPQTAVAESAIVSTMMRRAEALLSLGDISGARRFLERAEAAGSARAAVALAETYDPATLSALQTRGLQPDPAAALAWYRRAAARGASVAPRIQALEAP
jgi:hypothetical protein